MHLPISPWMPTAPLLIVGLTLTLTLTLNSTSTLTLTLTLTPTPTPTLTPILTPTLTRTQVGSFDKYQPAVYALDLLAAPGPKGKRVVRTFRHPKLLHPAGMLVRSGLLLP